MSNTYSSKTRLNSGDPEEKSVSALLSVFSSTCSTLIWLLLKITTDTQGFFIVARLTLISFSLYIIDSRSKLSRSPTDPETKLKLKTHLKTEADGKCKRQCVQVTQVDSPQKRVETSPTKHWELLNMSKIRPKIALLQSNIQRVY